MTMMPQTDGGVNSSLIDRHDGCEATREDVDGTVEYEIVVDRETLDELPDDLSADEFAERLAVSKTEQDLNMTTGPGAGNAMAKEDDSSWEIDGKKFTVWVRV